MKLDRNPLDGKCPGLVAKYGVETEFGRLLRKAEAQTRLNEMEAAEASIAAEEERSRGIEHRLQQIEAIHHVNMQYLLEFGVAADERNAFRAILQEVVEHGGLTIREASNLAFARTQSQSSNAGGAASSPLESEVSAFSASELGAAD